MIIISGGWPTCIQQTTREAIDEGLRLLKRAIKLDPAFAPAYGSAAWCYGQRASRKAG